MAGVSAYSAMIKTFSVVEQVFLLSNYVANHNLSQKLLEQYKHVERGKV